MPRRKQDCPKRMKWEGGEEGSPEDEDKVEGDEDSRSVTPNSAASPAPGDEDITSPPPGDLPSPHGAGANHLHDGEMTSPRTPSRESPDSGPPRCPSTEPKYPDRNALLRGVPLAPSALSPVGVALPPTLPVAAAAALLPPQSAAMAAYLNAAAAAAQHSHRLMMTSPLPGFNRSSVSPLVSSSSSPPGLLINPAGSLCSPSEGQLQSPSGEPGVLDFSRRASTRSDESEDRPDSPVGDEVMTSSPLDLSVTTRKRVNDDPSSQPPARKPRPAEYKPQVLPQWSSPVAASHLPYFAAAVAAASTLSPKTPTSDLWNGKMKHSSPSTSDATKALEKMSELSKLGGEDLFRSMASSGGAPVNSSGNSRHSAWQSHWLNKGAEQAKDVLKCVWCKQSFPSLQALTTHMKEAKHCGVNVPVPPMQSQNIPPHQNQNNSPSNSNTSSSSTSSKPNPSDLNLLIKETMPLPRKLVRGQDVWLGKGAEQTRQILKCMWCGQSFRSLAEMTSHMQQTQHYTNIISQEQIISWRSTEDGKNGGPATGPPGSNGPPGSTSSHVSAVLTCKVCDQAFSSLKELSNHMVKNSHYKEHIMRSITESGGRRRQTREKRKKSLPVRKLLELERAQHELKNGENGSIVEKARQEANAGRITCEKCGNKIETSLFVDHIRQCVGGGSLGNSQRNFLKSALMSNNILPPESPHTRDSRKNSSNKSPSPVSNSSRKSPDTPTSKDNPPESNNGSSPSVLNAIEKLIEKSFDSRGRQNPAFPGHGHTQAPMGSSILKRLGIDESVDYTKPLVDAQTMNLLRSYHHQQSHYNRRERSGSESSSISERGSSRIDALTPERKMDPPGSHVMSTPRSTPDIKREKSPISEKADVEMNEVSVKKEVEEDDRSSACGDFSQGEIKIKKENDDEEDDERESVQEKDRSKNEDEDMGKRMSPMVGSPPATSPGRNSTSSPASSERSCTPRSTNGDRKGGSLGALSSMFDSLSGVGGSSENTNSTSGKRGSSHPLAALQKLCDKTETHHTNNRNSAPAPTHNAIPASTSTASTPGAILAFSWACNDAVVTSDSIMKCAFCDTPFISKGAYRHHLSKMHFVKDGVIPDPVTIKSSQPSGSGASPASSKAPPAPATPSGSASVESKSPPSAGFEESPHSKFLKYTELAKQLSSKYV